MNVDLHIHSTASDGTLSPEAIFELAERLGLAAISITDHDTLEGTLAGRRLAGGSNVRFLTGVEISTAAPRTFPIPGSLHILGYGIDPLDAPLNRMLACLRRARHDRNPRIIEKLQRLGIAIDLTEVARMTGADQIGRPHIAAALVGAGYADSVEDAFRRFLGNGRPAYVDKFRVDCRRAIEAIVAAGGIAALAHPGLVPLERDEEVAGLVRMLTDAGLGALEVYYPGHRSDQTRRFEELARGCNLLPTGGTDFHGTTTPGLRMGFGRGAFAVPLRIYEALAAAAEHSRRTADSFDTA